MGKGRTYSSKLMLDKLKDIVIKNWGSKYHLSKPRWETYLYRMKRDPAFADKVNDILTESELLWHKRGMKMMISEKTTSARMNFFKYLTASKKSFMSYEDNALLERLDDLEGGYED